jgi:Flp pilus assembly protein TadD
MSWRDGRSVIAEQLLKYGGGNMAAKSLLNRVVSHNPKDSYSWHMLGCAYYRSGDYAKAAEAFQAHLDLEPYDPNANYWLGESLAKLGYTDEAEMYSMRADKLKLRRGHPRNLKFERRSGFGSFLGWFVIVVVLVVVALILLQPS